MEYLKNQKLSLLPIRDIVILPGLTIPVYVSEAVCKKTIYHAIEQENSFIFLSTFQTREARRRGGEAFVSDLPIPYDVFNFGTIGVIQQVKELEDGRLKVLIVGQKRAIIRQLIETVPYPLVKFDEAPPYPAFEETDVPIIQDFRDSLLQLFSDKPFLNLDHLHRLDTLQSLEEILRTIASFYKFSILDGQEILVGESKSRIFEIITQNIKRQENIQKNMLNGLLAVSSRSDDHKGHDDDNEIEQFKQRLLNAKMTLQPLQECEKQLRRLAKMNSESGEANIIRTYLERMLELPWHHEPPAALDLKLGKEILDTEHGCLDEVKEKILDFLAVQHLNPQAKGPIMCLVGPPGIGKTSIAKSIAKALNRKFVRISMGGLRDEAEIRGHRLTYLGACPGRLIQAIQKAGTTNLVIVLDEIDKMAHDHRGDPAAALLEVLDREQNHSFSDHYINVPYDLSNVFFIANANDLSSIPYPLRDRLECIEIGAYSLEEKMRIAQDYLIPKQKKQTGLESYNIYFSPLVVREIIESFTNEPGVRQLDRSFHLIFRRIARDVLLRHISAQDPIHIHTDDLIRYLGVKAYRPKTLSKDLDVGLSFGLAYSQLGGEVLRIESHFVEGNEGITITGNIGQIMQESIRTAMCVLKVWPETRLSPKWSQMLYCHIPEGAIPKDGPSAGLAILASLYSALMDVVLKEPIAFTGEINSFGHIIPVGGIKDKILAAVRSHIKRIFIPEGNRKEFEGFQDLIPIDTKVTFIQHAKEILHEGIFERVCRKNTVLDLVNAENF